MTYVGQSNDYQYLVALIKTNDQKIVWLTFCQQ